MSVTSVSGKFDDLNLLMPKLTAKETVGLEKITALMSKLGVKDSTTDYSLRRKKLQSEFEKHFEEVRPVKSNLLAKLCLIANTMLLTAREQGSSRIYFQNMIDFNRMFKTMTSSIRVDAVRKLSKMPDFEFLSIVLDVQERIDAYKKQTKDFAMSSEIGRSLTYDYFNTFGTPAVLKFGEQTHKLAGGYKYKAIDITPHKLMSTDKSDEVRGVAYVPAEDVSKLDEITCYFTWAGTNNIATLKADVAQKSPGDVSYRKLQNQILETTTAILSDICEINPGKKLKIVVQGHSLGGALSQMHMIDIMDQRIQASQSKEKTDPMNQVSTLSIEVWNSAGLKRESVERSNKMADHLLKMKVGVQARFGMISGDIVQTSSVGNILSGSRAHIQVLKINPHVNEYLGVKSLSVVSTTVGILGTAAAYTVAAPVAALYLGSSTLGSIASLAIGSVSTTIVPALQTGYSHTFIAYSDIAPSCDHVLWDSEIPSHKAQIQFELMGSKSSGFNWAAELDVFSSVPMSTLSEDFPNILAKIGDDRTKIKHAVEWMLRGFNYDKLITSNIYDYTSHPSAETGYTFLHSIIRDNEIWLMDYLLEKYRPLSQFFDLEKRCLGNSPIELAIEIGNFDFFKKLLPEYKFSKFLENCMNRYVDLIKLNNLKPIPNQLYCPTKLTPFELMLVYADADSIVKHIESMPASSITMLERNLDYLGQTALHMVLSRDDSLQILKALQGCTVEVAKSTSESGWSLFSRSSKTESIPVLDILGCMVEGNLSLKPFELAAKMGKVAEMEILFKPVSDAFPKRFGKLKYYSVQDSLYKEVNPIPSKITDAYSGFLKKNDSEILKICELPLEEFKDWLGARIQDTHFKIDILVLMILKNNAKLFDKLFSELESYPEKRKHLRHRLTTFDNSLLQIATTYGNVEISKSICDALNFSEANTKKWIDKAQSVKDRKTQLLNFLNCSKSSIRTISSLPNVEFEQFITQSVQYSAGLLYDISRLGRSNLLKTLIRELKNHPENLKSLKSLFITHRPDLMELAIKHGHIKFVSILSDFFDVAPAVKADNCDQAKVQKKLFKQIKKAEFEKLKSQTDSEPKDKHSAELYRRNRTLRR